MSDDKIDPATLRKNLWESLLVGVGHDPMDDLQRHVKAVEQLYILRLISQKESATPDQKMECAIQAYKTLALLGAEIGTWILAALEEDGWPLPQAVVTH